MPLPSIPYRRPFLLAALLAVCIPFPVPAPAQVGALRVDMPSPTAASLGTFGDVPVGLYTGTPSISIPLHTVRGRTLSVPITLSYHASGVKVEETPGWVGAGWALSAGGVITRTVRGLPDDGLHGYLETGALINDFLWNAASNASLKTFLEGSPLSSQEWDDYTYEVDQKRADPEPDQFFFNVAGRSGQFFFDASGAVRVVPHQKITIEYDAPTLLDNFTGIPGWTLTMEDGTTFRFGEAAGAAAREYTHDTALLPPCAQCSSVSGWYLLEIATPARDEVITFDYTTPTPIVHDRKPHYSKVSGLDACRAEGSASEAQHVERVETIRLERITSSLESVAFTSSLRASGYQTPEEFKLDGFAVHEENAAGPVYRAFQFSYAPLYGQRLYLVAAQESGYGSASLPPYAFSYHPGTLPPPSSNDVDHWGYYNAAGNDAGGSIPDLLYDDGYAFQYFGGIDKSPASTEVIAAGTLAEITYPTGGAAQFTYERHAYGHVGASPVADRWSPRRRSEQAHAPEDGTRDTRPFTVGGTAPAPVEVWIRWDLDAAHPPGNDCNPEACLFARLLDGSNTPVATFSDFHLQPPFPGAPHVTTEHLALEAGAYTLEVRNNATGLSSGIAARVSWREQEPATERPAGGLRIKEIRTTDGRGGPDVVKTFEYTHLDSGQNPRSSGVLTYEPRYFYAEAFSLENGLCTQLRRSVRPVSGLGLTQGSPLGYEQVTVRQGSGGAFGETVHTFATARLPEHADADDPGDPLDDLYVWDYAARTSRDFKRGHPLGEAQIADGGATLVAKDFLHYHADADPAPPGSTFRSTRAIALVGQPTNEPGTGGHYFKRYEVLSAWSYLASETITTHDPGGTASTTATRTFEYADPDHLQLTRLTEATGDGQQRTTDHAYAHQTYPGMDDAHMLSQPYSTTVSEPGTSLRKEWTTWAYLEEGWRPREAWT
ncbi:MAG: hypothetical protein R3247_02345, partial [Rhodothermales bacterium]|nr:hypothetical protein [Rhodothermales bacterium]